MKKLNNFMFEQGKTAFVEDIPELLDESIVHTLQSNVDKQVAVNS